MSVWILRLGILALSVVLGGIRAPRAQPGPIGVGAQVGAPGGLSARLMLGKKPTAATGFDAVAVSAAFTLDGYVLIQSFLTRDVPIADSPIRLFVGPGLAAGAKDRDAIFGVGAVGGARFYRNRFEVFLQAAPRIHLWPGLKGIMGAGVGLRYYP